MPRGHVTIYNDAIIMMSTWVHIYLLNTLLNNAGVKGPFQSSVWLQQFRSKFGYISILFPYLIGESEVYEIKLMDRKEFEDLLILN